MSNASYSTLRNARQAERIARKSYIPKEKQLRELRQTLYYWNKLYDIAPVENDNDGDVEMEAAEEEEGEVDVEEEEGEADVEEGEEDEAQGIGGRISWDRFNFENYTEKLDISAFGQNQNSLRQLVFSGTDYGIRKMSETVPQTLAEILVHCNRFQTLQNLQGKATLQCNLFYLLFKKKLICYK